jgi:hypothetical protein
LLTSGQDHNEYDITQPLNPKNRSYALRMAEILDILEQVKGRSQLDILSDLVTNLYELKTGKFHQNQHPKFKP